MFPPDRYPGPLPQQPPPYGGRSAPQHAPGPVAAGFGRRLTARLVDYGFLAFIAFAFFFVVLVLILLVSPGAMDEDFQPADAFFDAWAMLFFFGWGGLFFLYDWLCHAGWGRTLGKLVTGIRVVDRSHGGRLTQGQALGRAALFGLPQSVPCIGQLFTLFDCSWPLWDEPLRQSLHDKAAKTIVVRV